MRKGIVPALAVLGLLASCGGKTVVTETTVVTDETTSTTQERPIHLACLSDEQLALVGTPLDQARTSLPENVRVIQPGALYTQEYQPTRVNADVDANSVITRVWCG